jgi:hypothetical protein
VLRPLAPLFERLPAAQRGALEAAFGASPNGTGDRFLTAAGALGVLAEAAEEQPLLCVVDDLQWLDRPSVDALVFVARRLGAEPIALLLATRDGEPVPAGLTASPSSCSAGSPRRRPRGARARRAASRRPSGSGCSTPPAASRSRCSSCRAGRSARGWSAAARSSARLPSASRRCLEPARRAVLLAAADDDPTGRPALRALPAAADLAPAEAGDLLRVAGGRIAFRHPLVRSAAYGLASFDERRAAHAALADVLTGPGDADRRAWHRAAAAATPDDDVADELARSADRARARGGDAAAAAALERAARLTSDEPARAQRLVAAADAARIAGDADRALALAAETLALGVDGDIAAEATAVRGAVHSHRGDVAAAQADLRAAAEALAPRQPQRALRIALLAGEAAAFGGRHGEAAEIAAWAAGLPAGDGDVPQGVRTFADGLAHLFAGRHAEAAARFRELPARAERSGDPGLMTWAAMAAIYAGDIAAARRGFAQAVAVARDRGAIWHVSLALDGLAWVESLTGRFGPAATSAAEALELGQASGEQGAAAQAGRSSRGTPRWAVARRSAARSPARRSR